MKSYVPTVKPDKEETDVKEPEERFMRRRKPTRADGTSASFKKGPDRYRVAIEDLLTPEGTLRPVMSLIGDRSRSDRYVPRFADSGIDYDLPGGLFLGQRPEYYGIVAWTSPGMQQAASIARAAYVSGGLTALLLGAPEASLGNLNFSCVYALELQHEVARGAVKQAEIDQAVREGADTLRRVAIDEHRQTLEKIENGGKPESPKAFTPFIDPLLNKKIEGLDDYLNLAKRLPVMTRHAFMRLLGGQKYVARFRTIPRAQVLQGFNDPAFAGLPIGTVVAFANLDPVRCVAEAAWQSPDLAYNSSITFLHRGTHLGNVAQPFPARVLYGGVTKSENQADLRRRPIVIPSRQTIEPYIIGGSDKRG